MSPIIATANDSKSYEPCPAGTHHAVCVDVIDLGMKPNPFKPGEMMEVKAKPARNVVKVRALKPLKEMV